MPFRRVSGAFGILAVVLFVASFAAYGSVPSVDATAAEVAEYVADTSTYPLANALGALSALSMLVYFSGFAVPFARSDREHLEAYGTVVIGTAVVAVTSIALAVGMFAALSNRLEELDEGALWVLWDGGNIMFAVAILTVLVGAGAAAVAIMRRGIMPRWFGWLSGLVALTGLTGLIPFFTDGAAVQAILVGFVGILLWILVGGILLVRSEAAALSR